MRERLHPSSRFFALSCKKKFRVVLRLASAQPSVFKFSKPLNGFYTPENLAQFFMRYMLELYFHGFYLSRKP